MQAFKTFRSYFARGLAALLPTIVTIWIFFQCYQFIHEHISGYINKGVVRVIVFSIDWYPQIDQEEIRQYVLQEYPTLQGDAEAIGQKMSLDEVYRGARIHKAEKYWVSGPGQITGFILAIIGVCFIGALLASVVGRSLWRFFEKALVNAPLINRVYPYIKQITDLVLTKKDRLEFNKVIAVEYPRKGIWSIGLVTGKGIKCVSGTVRKDVLTVFIPSSPTPFTGYVIMVAAEDAIDLDITVEQALRFTISGGVITPGDLKAFEESGNKEAV